jgi:hypothetical protein
LAGAVQLDRDGRQASSRASGPVIGSLDELPELLGLP